MKHPADELAARGDRLAAATLLKPILPRDPTLEIMNCEQWSPPKQPLLRDGSGSRRGRSLAAGADQGRGFDPAAQGEAIAAIESRFPRQGQQHASATDLMARLFHRLVNASTRGESEWLGRISTVGFIIRCCSPIAASPYSPGCVALPPAHWPGRRLPWSSTEMHGITLAFGSPCSALPGVSDPPAQPSPCRESALQSVRGLWPLLLTAIASACMPILLFLPLP